MKCDDSSKNEVYVLDKPNIGLLVSPGIWTEQKYIENNTFTNRGAVKIE